jgi:hypothetical protein
MVCVMVCSRLRVGSDSSRAPVRLPLRVIADTLSDVPHPCPEMGFRGSRVQIPPSRLSYEDLTTR